VGWRSGGPIWSTIALACDERDAEVHVQAAGRGDHGTRFAIRVQDDPDATAGEPFVVEVLPGALASSSDLAFVVAGVRARVRFLVAGDVLWLDDGEGARAYQDVTHRP